MAQNNIVVVVAGQDDASGVLRQIEQHLVQLKDSGNQAGNSLASVGDKIKSTLSTVGLAVALQQAIGALQGVVTGALDVGTQLENMNKKTGVSVSTLSVLRYASILTGNDFERASRGVARMDKAIADAAAGDKEAGGMFQQLGLNVKDLVNAPNGAEIAFMRLGKRLADTSGPERQGVAMHLLGRGGMDLLPVLLQVGANYDYLKQKAMEAGQYFDEKSASQLAETNRKLADMKLKVEGAGIAFTEGLTPGINAVLNIISNGKGSFDAMTTFGHALGRSLAFAEAAAYGLVTGLLKVAELAALSKADFLGAQALSAKADEYGKKSQDAMYFAKTGHGGTADAPDPLSGIAPTGGPPAQLPSKPDNSGAKKEAALKQLNADLAKLYEESAQVRYQAIKAESDRRLAELENAHKEELVSDADFYAQKLAIQQAELQAEKKAELEKQAAIDSNIAQLQKSVTKHGGRETVNESAGTMSVEADHRGDAVAMEDEAKIADLLAKRLEVSAKIAEIAAKSGQAELQYATDVYEMKKKQLEVSDSLAVKREEDTGGSVDARLQKNSDEYTQQKNSLDANLASAQSKLVADQASGDKGDIQDDLDRVFQLLKDMANLAANFKTKNDKTRLDGAQETYGLQKAQIEQQRTMVSDAVARGEMTSQQGSEQTKALNMQQANDLQPILDAYKELANNDQNLAAKEKVIELSTQIAELKDPIDEVAAHMREQWDSAFEGLFENLDKGKKEWKSFTQEIQKMVLQDTFKQFLEPALQAGLGQVFKNGGNGIPFAGGNKKTPTIGSALAQARPGIGSILNKSGVTSGAGSGITVQIINQTSAPAQATATPLGQGQGGDLTEMIRPSVIQILLENLESNGSIGQVLSGLGGLLA